jgi:hypothetical protein
VILLLLDLEVLFRVDIYESSTGEYIKYSASPNLGYGGVEGGGLFGGDGFMTVEVEIVAIKLIISPNLGRALPFSPIPGLILVNATG